MDARNTGVLANTFLVIHINTFTKKMDSGYIRSGKSKVSAYMTPHEVGEYIAAHPHTRLDPQLV